MFRNRNNYNRHIFVNQQEDKAESDEQELRKTIWLASNMSSWGGEEESEECGFWKCKYKQLLSPYKNSSSH
jgi:hypothetical protein